MYITYIPLHDDRDVYCNLNGTSLLLGSIVVRACASRQLRRGSRGRIRARAHTCSTSRAGNGVKRCCECNFSYGCGLSNS